MHKGLQDIPLGNFPIWNVTLDYERGLPHFRQRPEFSEEGILMPTAGGYTYQQLRRLPMPATSQSSTTVDIELEKDSPQIALPPSQYQYEMGSSSPRQQTPSSRTSPQSTSSQIQPPGGDSSYNVDSVSNPHYPYLEVFYEGPHYMCGIPAEPSFMEEFVKQSEQTYTRAIFMPTSLDSTSAPHDMQWNPHDAFSPYGQLQDHNEPMTSSQQDVQMADLFWLSS